MLVHHKWVELSRSSRGTSNVGARFTSALVPLLGRDLDRPQHRLHGDLHLGHEDPGFPDFVRSGLHVPGVRLRFAPERP